MLSLQPRVYPDDSVICAELDGEMVLLNINSGVYFGLDEIGSDIWKLLTDGADADAIVAALLENYDVERDELQGDVAAFIRQLTAKGLLREERD